MDTAEFIEKVEKIKMIYRILILIGTILLFVILFVWLVYLPKTEGIEKLSKSNAQLNAEISKAKQKAANKEQFEADVAMAEEQYKEALTLLPKTEEIPSLLVNITELGTTSNLEFKSFAPTKGPDEHMYTQIPVSIQVTGKYHDVLMFFDRVGKLKRIVNIQNVTMSPAGDSSNLNVSCKAVTYKFKE